MNDNELASSATVEWVVEHGDVRPSGVQHPQLVEAPRTMDVRLFGRADHPRQVLSDDVAEKSRLAGARHPQHDPLHDADLVRPQPRLTVDIVAEHHCVLGPCIAGETFVPLRRDY